MCLIINFCLAGSHLLSVRYVLALDEALLAKNSTQAIVLMRPLHEMRIMGKNMFDACVTKAFVDEHLNMDHFSQNR